MFLFQDRRKDSFGAIITDVLIASTLKMSEILTFKFIELIT